MSSSARVRRAPVAILSVLAVLAAGLVAAAPAQAASPDLVISQVYGGGGNAGATYTHDYHGDLQPGHNRRLDRQAVDPVHIRCRQLRGTSPTADRLRTPAARQVLPRAAGGRRGWRAQLSAARRHRRHPDTMAAASRKVALLPATPRRLHGAPPPATAAAARPIVDLVGYGDRPGRGTSRARPPRRRSRRTHGRLPQGPRHARTPITTALDFQTARRRAQHATSGVPSRETGAQCVQHQPREQRDRRTSRQQRERDLQRARHGHRRVVHPELRDQRRTCHDAQRWSDHLHPRPGRRLRHERAVHADCRRRAGRPGPNDPPDPMASDHVVKFTTAAPPPPTVKNPSGPGPGAHLPFSRHIGHGGRCRHRERTNAFWLQEEDAQSDADPGTSEGISSSRQCPSRRRRRPGQGLRHRRGVPPGRGGGHRQPHHHGAQRPWPRRDGALLRQRPAEPHRDRRRRARATTAVIDDDATGDVETPAPSTPPPTASTSTRASRGCGSRSTTPSSPARPTPSARSGCGRQRRRRSRTARGGIVVRPSDFNPERIQVDDGIAGVTPPPSTSATRSPGRSSASSTTTSATSSSVHDDARVSPAALAREDDRRRWRRRAGRRRRSTSRTSTRATRSPSSTSWPT